METINILASLPKTSALLAAIQEWVKLSDHINDAESLYTQLFLILEAMGCKDDEYYLLAAMYCLNTEDPTLFSEMNSFCPRYTQINEDVSMLGILHHTPAHELDEWLGENSFSERVLVVATVYWHVIARQAIIDQSKDHRSLVTGPVTREFHLKVELYTRGFGHFHTDTPTMLQKIMQKDTSCVPAKDASNLTV